MKTFEGKLQAKGFKIGIVSSRFNQFLTGELLGGALDALKKLGADDADIVIYKASLVPVGKDQAAHLELSREIVRAFNRMRRIAAANREVALKLLDALEDNDDVQNVYSNLDVDEAELEKVGG